MSSSSAQRIALTAHPCAAGEAVRSIAVSVARAAHGILRLEYVLRADMARISVPHESPPGRADGLWKHTCFEAFIAPHHASPHPDGEYFELNFAPSRKWAAYCFSGYRHGMSAATLSADPELDVRHGPHWLELSVRFPLPGSEALPGTEAQSAKPMRLGLAAVVEEDNGRLSYWALRHCAGRPDFHHPAGFVLELP